MQDVVSREVALSESSNPVVAETAKDLLDARAARTAAPDRAAKLQWIFGPDREQVSDALTAHGPVVAISDTDNITDEIELGFADGTVVRVSMLDEWENRLVYAIGTPIQQQEA